MMRNYAMTFGTTLGAPVRARTPENAARRVYGNGSWLTEKVSTHDGRTWWEVYSASGEWLDDMELDD